jgi:hypothetical protein
MLRNGLQKYRFWKALENEPLLSYCDKIHLFYLRNPHRKLRWHIITASCHVLLLPLILVTSNWIWQILLLFVLSPHVSSSKPVIASLLVFLLVFSLEFPPNTDRYAYHDTQEEKECT